MGRTLAHSYGKFEILGRQNREREDDKAIAKHRVMKSQAASTTTAIVIAALCIISPVQGAASTDAGDTISYSAATAGVNINLTNKDVHDPGDPADAGIGYDAPILNVENVLGSNHGDIIYGNAGVNVLTGGNGSDEFYGLGSGDTINTRDNAADTVDCGEGVDTVFSDRTDTVNANCETNHVGEVIDNTPPTNLMVKIDGGRAVTRDRAVVLNLSATDSGSGVAWMRFSNDGRTWTGWQAYAATRKWTLKKGKAGTRAVYAQVMDGAGNPSAVARDTIRYRPR